MSTVPDTAREWLAIEDPDEERTWLFDVSFLTSSWTCIYGRGCPGIEQTPAPEAMVGCCSHGAWLDEDDDRDRVLERLAELDTDEWQLAELAGELGGAVYQDDDGNWRTRVVDGACIVQNRPGGAAPAGCALHHAAQRRDEPIHDWKPDVCWQAPLRREDTLDTAGRVWSQIREWTRADWGEGGEDFGWWCIEEAEAFVGSEPVYAALADDLVRLTSPGIYDELCRLLDARGSTSWLPHPTVR